MSKPLQDHMDAIKDCRGIAGGVLLGLVLWAAFARVVWCFC